MIAGVVIDSWKLAVFRRRLEEADLEYTVHAGPTFTTLKVKCDYVHKLKPIIEAAQKECAEVKR